MKIGFAEDKTTQKTENKKNQMRQGLHLNMRNSLSRFTFMASNDSDCPKVQHCD